MGAAAITALLGHYRRADGVAVINAVIGFIQEGKAESALDAIRRDGGLVAYPNR